MCQPSYLGVESEPRFTLLLSNLELPFFIFPDVCDFDLATEGRKYSVLFIVDRCREHRNLFAQGIMGALSLTYYEVSHPLV